MKILYFTATGNSLYVARRIGGELISVAQLMEKDEVEIRDSAVGIVCPVYAGDLPKMVRRFLEKARIETDYFFFIYTYGMHSTTAEQAILAASRRAGLSPDYAAGIRMVDNFLPGFRMEEQIACAAEKNIEQRIDEVCADINERKKVAPRATLRGKIFLKLLRLTLGKNVLADSAAKKYTVSDACTKCGLCAKVCPAANIRLSDNVEFGGQCEVCYACIHNCPQSAIHLPDEQSGKRFRNEHVALQELIDSNMRS